MIKLDQKNMKNLSFGDFDVEKMLYFPKKNFNNFSGRRVDGCRWGL